MEELWPGQAELIRHAMAGRDAIGILPTGGGKSLCYQLPALFLDGLVVVVSPLLALMQDQHEHLAEADIEAARLDSTLSARKVRQEEAALGRGDRRIVLLTPERLSRPENLEFLQRRRVALFVVDEAHCVSIWGYDFRPAYLELRHTIEQLGHPPVLALTATAPPDRLDDILAQLGIPDAAVVRGSARRVRVITAELERQHVLSRQRALRRMARSMSDAEIESFVGSFQKSALADEKRLRTMMDYAESARCRVQFLREYFGEPMGEPCGRCDNCRRPIQPSIQPISGRRAV